MFTSTLLLAAAVAGPSVAQATATPLDALDPTLDISAVPEAEGALPADLPIDGPWRLVSTLAGVRTWEAPLPARTRTLFFHRPPKGMKVVTRPAGSDSWDKARPLTHRQGASSRHATWSFDSHSVRIRRKADAGPPAEGTVAMRFPTGTEREAAIRAPIDDARSFVVRSLQLDDSTQHGWYLLPGTRAEVSFAVPTSGALHFGSVSVPPEASPPHVARDGQVLEVRLTDPDGVVHVVHTSRPSDAVTTAHRVDLSAWAGQQVSVSFTAPADGIDQHDAVFVTDPALVTPDPTPPRVVVVFIDTLRQDALSLYGNTVPTSPGIDAWAADATVFTQARSVAPWTLPTARSLFSGRMPELWGEVSDLPSLLHDAGWATAFIAGNIYLSSNFDMADNWSLHRCVNWPQADVQVDRARRWLDQQADRPALLVLHFMDMHLPYTEPEEFRSTFAGPTPLPFTSDVFHRNQVVKWERDMDDDARAWLRGRYHNNLAYIDSVLTPFLAELPEHSTVLLLSDHGEEFWDHGDFEHGHTLYEELLRVPLVVRGPGFPAGKVDAPTSLLDVAPTILQIAGIDTETDGVPLQDIAADPTPFVDRAIGFGRPLYGQRRWGVVKGTHKYTTWKSTETVVDLAEDPLEEHNLLPRGASAAQWRATLSEALRTPVYVAWSLLPQRSSKAPDLTAQITVPNGVVAAWAAEDPTLMSQVTTTVDGSTVAHTWAGGMRGSREAYVVPEGDALDALLGATIDITVDDTTRSVPLPDAPPVMDGKNHVIGRVRVGGRAVSLQATVVPLPPEESVGIEGFDPEVEAELEALGYLDH